MNQFEELCKLASDENWCWNLCCTTCGQMHFRYAFAELAAGKSPMDPGWIIHGRNTHYEKSLGPLPHSYTEDQKMKIAIICRNADLSSIAAVCKFPDWLGYLGLVLSHMHSDTESYRKLSEIWARQLSKLVQETSAIRKTLDEIAAGNGVLNIGDLEACEKNIMHNKGPLYPSNQALRKATMYERFTDLSRKAMALANQQAQHYNHEYIGTEHILLGLALVRDSMASQALHNLGTNVAELQMVVKRFVKKGPSGPSSERPPQTPRAKEVVKWAIEEARVLRHHYIGTEHILLGLLQVKDGIAYQVLYSTGISYNKAIKEILRLLGGEDTVDKTLIQQYFEKTKKDTIQVLEDTDDFTVCPECGYDGGFHTVFYGLHSNEQAKWILICPSCKEKYDIGLRYPG